MTRRSDAETPRSARGLALRRPIWHLGRVWLAWLVTAFTLLPASAHDLELTQVEARFEAGGAFEVDMVCDLDALALGRGPEADDIQLAAHLSTLPAEELAQLEEGLARLFERRVRLRFDGEPAPFEVSWPDRKSPGEDPEDTFLGLTARLSGTVPAGAEQFQFFASRTFPPVSLTVVTPAAISFETIEHGSRSGGFSLAGPTPGAGWRSFVSAIRLGFVHILPAGLDHVLFVLGLFLLATRMRPLIWQITAFTVAHTVTLGLATAGVISLPSRPVEIIIALSIAYVGVENLFTERLHPWRPVLVFLFGLLHGLGFAGVLGEARVPSSQLVPTLLGFNLGVEIGQLAVVAIAFLLLAGFRKQPWYPRLTRALSLLIALAGLYWAFERWLA